jgi:hypothetical protein
MVTFRYGLVTLRAKQLSAVSLEPLGAGARPSPRSAVPASSRPAAARLAGAATVLPAASLRSPEPPFRTDTSPIAPDRSSDSKVSPELDAKAVVAALLAEQPLPADRSIVPDKPGFYAWWAKPANLTDADPPIPAVYPPGSLPGWSLLYVGIAPKHPSKTGVDRTIAARISKDHRGGNIGGSTFRQSLASILRTSLALSPKRGHERARLVDEAPLSRWIDATCALTTAVTATPSRVEDDVIRTLGAPLNLRPGYHEFRFVVEEARRALRRDCAA